MIHSLSLSLKKKKVPYHLFSLFNGTNATWICRRDTSGKSRCGKKLTQKEVVQTQKPWRTNERPPLLLSPSTKAQIHLSAVKFLTIQRWSIASLQRAHRCGVIYISNTPQAFQSLQTRLIRQLMWILFFCADRELNLVNRWTYLIFQADGDIFKKKYLKNKNSHATAKKKKKELW